MLESGWRNRRPTVPFVRLPAFLQTAVFERDAPASQLVDQCDVVTGYQQRYADLIKTTKNAHDLE
jgi:hypothetical protein